MNFRKVSDSLAVSDDGAYEIRMAVHGNGKRFHNAWHVPTDRHIEAGFNKEAVKESCRKHRDKSVIL